MVEIKSFTSLEQSRKLAEILPLESADMCYVEEDELQGHYMETVYTATLHTPYHNKKCIPCWSLAALINVIPKEIFNGEYVINIAEGLDKKWIITYDAGNSVYFYGLVASADNLINAFVDIIEKLHKLKML